MRAVPLTLAQANAEITRLHRHHKPVIGHRFSIGAWHEGRLVGVVIVGRPVARMTDQYQTAEVTRLATDGTKNACSFLYAKAAQAADALGYDYIQTFTLKSEPGTSLRAVGWKEVDGPRASDGWDSRPGRRKDQPRTAKRKWRRSLRGFDEELTHSA